MRIQEACDVSGMGECRQKWKWMQPNSTRQPPSSATSAPRAASSASCAESLARELRRRLARAAEPLDERDGPRRLRLERSRARRRSPRPPRCGAPGRGGSHRRRSRGRPARPPGRRRTARRRRSRRARACRARRPVRRRRRPRARAAHRARARDRSRWRSDRAASSIGSRSAMRRCRSRLYFAPAVAFVSSTTARSDGARLGLRQEPRRDRPARAPPATGSPAGSACTTSGCSLRNAVAF